MAEIVERAVLVAENSNEMTMKYQDKFLPFFFFTGYNLGERKIKFDELGDDGVSEFLKELYNKGKEIVSNQLKTNECKKCHKTITKEKETKFCQFCGEKI